MNEFALLDPRPQRHCDAVNSLRVHGDMPEAERARPRAANKVQLPAGKRINLEIGEVAASQAPVILRTVLGSCVAVCLCDPVLRVGGMNHILLPSCGTRDKSTRYGVHAMELLINELLKLGADKRRFLAKAFGGANMLPGIKIPPVGDANAAFVRQFLATEKIPLVAERLGGNRAVRVCFHTDTGRARVHTVDGSSLPRIVDGEESFSMLPSPCKPCDGEITLF